MEEERREVEEVEEEQEEVEAGAALVRKSRRGGAGSGSVGVADGSSNGGGGGGGGERNRSGHRRSIYFDENQGIKSAMYFTAVDEFILHKNVESGKADTTSFSTASNLPTLDNHLYCESPKIEIQTSHPTALESWLAIGTSESNTAVEEVLFHKKVKNGQADSTSFSTDGSHHTLDIHLHSESPKIEIQTSHPVAPESLHATGQAESNAAVEEFLLHNIMKNGKADSTSFSTASSLSNSDNLYSESPKTERQTSHTVASESWHAIRTSESNTSVEGHGQAKTFKGKETLIELDVERVLEEQDTHDLYCPNCHSCITKRVILRKRKRTIQEDSKAKLAKAKPVQIDLVAGSDAVETTDESKDTEQDVFRCLSCFSFFIPTDGGFKLFDIFRKKNESESLQSSQQVQAKKSWMSLLSWKNKENASGARILNMENVKNGETANASGTSQTIMTAEQPVLHISGFKQYKEHGYRKEDLPCMDSQAGIKQKSTFPADNIEGCGTLQSIQHSELETPTLAIAGEVSQIILQGQGEGTFGNFQNKKEEHKEDTKQESLRYSGGCGINESDEDHTSEHVPKKNMDLFNPFLFLKKTPSHEKIGKSKDPVISNQGAAPLGIADIDNNIVDIPISKNEGNGITSIPEDIIKTVQQELPVNVALPSPSQAKLPISPRLSPQIETRIDIGEQRTSEAGRRHDWDMLKAIVYGGLIEAITSLSVVSSAAGAGASILNIVALGLANLLSGLLLLFNNLLGLHQEEYETSDKEDRTTRYWKILGRRGHFGLHASVALLSFIIAGILPPVIYGFTFQKNDNKVYKLIATASASLLCIALLAIAKAHVQSAAKPYIKILFYYLGLGVSCSCLSFVAGVLIQKLLEKLGLFDNNSAVIPLPPIEFLQLNSSTPAWTSY